MKKHLKLENKNVYGFYFSWGFYFSAGYFCIKNLITPSNNELNKVVSLY